MAMTAGPNGLRPDPEVVVPYSNAESVPLPDLYGALV